MNVDPLLTILTSLLSGGIAGTLVTLLIEQRQRRRDTAVHIAQEYMAREPALAKAEDLYLKYARSPSQWNKDDTNHLVRIGNWYEVTAVLILERMADEKLIQRMGIDQAMLTFYDNVRQMEPLAYDVGQWDNMATYLNQGVKDG